MRPGAVCLSAAPRARACVCVHSTLAMRLAHGPEVRRGRGRGRGRRQKERLRDGTVCTLLPGVCVRRAKSSKQWGNEARKEGSREGRKEGREGGTTDRPNSKTAPFTLSETNTPTHTQQPERTNQRPATSDQQAATSKQRPATSDQQAASSKQQAAEQRPACVCACVRACLPNKRTNQ